MGEIPADHEAAPEGQGGERAKLVDVRESIRYRRRAQEAEQRCEALEAELGGLRQSRSAEATSVEEDLAEERRRRESLEQRMAQLESERRLERELIRAGARDPETALLVAKERLAAVGDAEVDAAALAQAVLAEKPYLKATQREEVPPLGRASQGVRPSARPEAGRVDRLASTARVSGQRSDLVTYMRARRNRRT